MTPFQGTVWRIIAADRAHDALAPARHPSGRFHHQGQVALYASLSAEGAAVAIRRYVLPGDGPRVIVPLAVDLARVVDLRGRPEGRAASVVWQDLHARGAPSPTWAYSDAARAVGAQALLYPSRSRPDLGHIVLFDLADTVVQAGPARPWQPPYPQPGHEATHLVWRALLPGENPLTDAPTEAGLFHHTHQPAFYGALSPEGATRLALHVARPDDPPRQLAAYAVRLGRVDDLGAEPDLPLDWWARAKAGAPVPSWERADAARAAGADALIWRGEGIAQIVVFGARARLSDTGQRLPCHLALPRDARDIYR